MEVLAAGRRLPEWDRAPELLFRPLLLERALQGQKLFKRFWHAALLRERWQTQLKVPLPAAVPRSQ